MLYIKHAIVIGPTPPGTGVIKLTLLITSLKFTSPNILIAAIGMTEFIDNNYVKDKATVIDVGINRKKINNKIKILGDVNFNDVINKVNLITPVPGGVGPMTIACLMYNTVKASFLRNNHEFKEIIFDE